MSPIAGPITVLALEPLTWACPSLVQGLNRS